MIGPREMLIVLVFAIAWLTIYRDALPEVMRSLIEAINIFKNDGGR